MNTMDNNIAKFLMINNISTEFQYGDDDLEYDPFADNATLIRHYVIFKHRIQEELINKRYFKNHILEELINRHYFKNHIHEELIAVVMHPCRIQAQMDQFDDIESYFEAIGC